MDGELKKYLLQMEERMLKMEERMLKMEKAWPTKLPKKEIKLPKMVIKFPNKATSFRTCDDEVVNVPTSLLKKSAYLDAFVSRWGSSGQHDGSSEEEEDIITTEHSKETMDHVHQLLCQPYISQDWDAQLEVAEYFGIDIHPSPFLLLQQGKFTVTRLGENSFNYSYFHPGTSKWLMAQIDKNRVTYFNRETREFSTVMCDMGQTFFDNTCYISGGMAYILMTNLTEFHVIHLSPSKSSACLPTAKLSNCTWTTRVTLFFKISIPTCGIDISQNSTHLPHTPPPPVLHNLSHRHPL